MIARSPVRRYSAKPPFVVMPGKVRSTQCMSSPARQARQRPHVITGWTMTASPGLTFRTPGPTSSTHPAFSWPRMYGSSTSTFSFQMPSMMCRSVRQRPAPPIRTMTSVGDWTSGAGTSSIDSSES